MVRFLCYKSLSVLGQSLIEEKLRQLQTENARLEAAVEQERQLNAAAQQQILDLQLVSQRLYASLQGCV